MLILAALAMVGILIIAALVIDLSVVRQNRQADKSASDFAAAAGVRGLDNASGVSQPWKGICAARDFLLANNDELAGMTETHATGAGTLLGLDPCADPSSPLYTGLCTTDTSTWGVLTGTADGGRVVVTIKSGYVLPDSAFPEDANASYATDTGSSAMGGCDHLAVIITEKESPKFGEVAGSTGHETVIRSVGRLVSGNEGDVTAALILLERNDCRVLDVAGTTASVTVDGSGVDPGVIHADSLGNGSCTGKIFHVNGETPPPRIIAARADAIDPVTSAVAPGQISTVALNGAPGVPGNVSDGVDHVCAQVLATDCGLAGGGNEPTARDLVGRGRVDARYRLPIIDLRDDAATRFAWSATTPPPVEAVPWTTALCTDAGPFTAPKIWIDCAGGDFTANGKVFEDTVDEVVINGSLRFTGSGNTVHFKDVRRLFIKGRVRLGSDNRILVNDGGMVDGTDLGDFVCDDRYGAAPLVRTEMVVGAGDVQANGGEFRLCQTTLFMMDNNGGSCPVPSTDGVAPYDNSCDGILRIAGGSRTDWSAPNVKNSAADPPLPDPDFQNFEDLAFWSESQTGPGTGWAIVGSGGVQLSGIFFTPNADPFKIGGSGAYDIEDAQFITRRLEVAGGGTLKMKPQPFNSIQIPVLGGFTLVR